MKPPVVAAAGAAVLAAGAFGAAGIYPAEHRTCAAFGTSLTRDTGPSFATHCLQPGLVLSLAVGAMGVGAIVLLYGVSLALRSWSQRQRRRPLTAGPWVVHDMGDEPSTAWWTRREERTSSYEPAPGWYRVPPDNALTWWDGSSWGPRPAIAGQAAPLYVGSRPASVRWDGDSTWELASLHGAGR